MKIAFVSVSFSEGLGHLGVLKFSSGFGVLLNFFFFSLYRYAGGAAY